MRAIVIPSDESLPVEEIDVLGLDDINRVVGGYIEYVPLVLKGRERHDVAPYCNEEGKLNNFAFNRRATEFLNESLRGQDFIVGNLILTGVDRSGETVGLPRDIMVRDIE
jgi:hypothetical protein